MDTHLRSHTVDDVIRRSAARAPHTPAIIVADTVWSYLELDDAVNATAARLVDRGMRPGDRLACYGGNSAAYVIAFLACCRAGVVHVPVNNALTEHELDHIISDCGPTVVAADRELLFRITGELRDDHHFDIVILDDGDQGLIPPRAERNGCAPVVSPAETHDLAQLLYTSGTTSRPKGAMLTHGALLAEYCSVSMALDLCPGDRPLVAMPLYHSAGMHIFTLPYLMLGACVRLLARPVIPELLRHIEKDRIDVLFLAPTVWIPMAHHRDLADRDLSSLRKAYYGASNMPTAILTSLRESLPSARFYNCFGQTEIGPLAMVLRPDDHDTRPGSCGQPVVFVEARVVDHDGHDLPPGEIGEIVYRSPQLCEGYWHNPDATAAAFRDGWFHSGDLARRDDAGYFTVVDRMSDVINTGGVLVSSREVEEEDSQTRTTRSDCATTDSV